MALFSLIAAAHVLAAVVWIGGIAFATLALLPALCSSKNPANHAELLQNIILRFRKAALVSSALLFATGLLQLYVKYGGFDFLLNGSLRAWHIAFMLFGWGFLTLAIVLLPRREMSRLQKFCEAKENCPEFHAFLGRMQKMHYAVLAFGTVLVINSMLVVFGI